MYVDRTIYKDRIVEKEILEEVQVEVEVERVQYVNQMEKEVKKIIEVPVETFRYEDRRIREYGILFLMCALSLSLALALALALSLSLPHLRSLTHTQITEVPKVRYVDKIVEMKVKVPRNVYKDKIIEVEKTVYVDVPVRMDNIITDVVETFTEVPVEIVRVEAV